MSHAIDYFGALYHFDPQYVQIGSDGVRRFPGVNANVSRKFCAIEVSKEDVYRAKLLFC